MKCFKEWPAALQRRWALLISAGAGILLVGLAVFFAFNDTMMLALSSLLTLFFFLLSIQRSAVFRIGGIHPAGCTEKCSRIIQPAAGIKYAAL